MANSKYEYVKKFESDQTLLLNCWLVVRIDGKCFHRFVDDHNFVKPNDVRGLSLMNRAASEVFKTFDCLIAYGESDEYSFVLPRDCRLYTRRTSKIVSSFASAFSSNYVFYWNEYFPDVKLQYPPTFDARVVCYPTTKNLLDYLAWRQVDCHINNLYNTSFWTLVKSGKTPKEAEDQLKGTLSDYKNELLFSQFGINYNNEPPMFKKGSIICKQPQEETFLDSRTNEQKKRTKERVVVLHEDFIGPDFWKRNPHILKLSTGEE